MFIIKAGNLINVENGKTETNKAVFIKNGLIENITDWNDDFSKDYEIHDLSKKTVLPGLIDCHIHLDMHGFADTFKENFVEKKLRTLRAAKEMGDTLKKGFTTVRNVGSPFGIDFAVKQGIEAGYFQGPDIITSGQIISITASGNDYFQGLYREADGPVETRKAAREQLKKGADFLKIMATGAVMNPGGVPGARQFDLDEVKAIVEEAEKLDLHVASHAHGREGIITSILAGCRTIEHATFMDSEVMDLMVEKNVFVVPTYIVDYHMKKAGEKGEIPKFMLEKINEQSKFCKNAFKEAVKKGVLMAFGTDAGTNYNYHGLNAMEMVELVKDEILTPFEAIKSATITSAQAIKLDHKKGSLSKGKSADILVLDENPVNNINAVTDKIFRVYKNGVMVD